MHRNERDHPVANQWSAGAELLQEVMAVKLRKQTATSFEIVDFKIELGWAYTNTKQYDEAIPLLQEVMEHRRQQLQQQPTAFVIERFGTAGSLLSECFMKREQYQRAVQVNQDILPVLQGSFAQDSKVRRLITVAKQNLAGSLSKLAKYDSAAVLYHELLGDLELRPTVEMQNRANLAACLQRMLSSTMAAHPAPALHLVGSGRHGHQHERARGRPQRSAGYVVPHDQAAAAAAAAEALLADEEAAAKAKEVAAEKKVRQKLGQSWI